MKTYFNYSVLSLVLLSSIACTRIEQGEVGLRVNFDKTVSSDELVSGSFNQTILGEVITFPIKDVAVEVNDLNPLAKDNSTMKDFDSTVIYGINPKSVSDLYINKNRSFHATVKGDTYLMYNYIYQTARNAIYKAAREYEALDMNDNRPNMEAKVKEIMTATLAAEKLDGMINVQQVQIRQIVPADTVVASANALVRAKNELKQREVEVKTAEAEARRMAALANQSSQSIAYMQAQAELNYSEAAKNGKINTIVVPRDFRGLINVK